MDVLLPDRRYAARSLRRQPAFCAAGDRHARARDRRFLPLAKPTTERQSEI
jgi:hypothetical protein